MSVWEVASNFVHRLLKPMDGQNILHAAVAAVVVLLSTKAGMHLYNRQRRCQLLLKMKDRGQRAKKGIEELREELKTCQVNTDIPNWNIKQLHAALQDGTVSAVEVLRAYQTKALEVNEQTNAITDVIKSAVALAIQLDKLPPGQRGPLHGIPISLKEACGLEGLDCTAGFGELVDIPLKKDSNLVKVLKSKGAVPFIRTNVPQGMRSFHSYNAIYGLTRNPHNPERSTGGSSSGEGAIIGGQGSILGIGSDLGGSVRNPAHFCGISSLRPTAGRLGNHGNFSVNIDGQTMVPNTDGPMARDVDTLVHLLKAILGPSLWELEPHVAPLPFDEEVFSSTRPLRIGYYVSDNNTRPLPAVERAINWAAKTLESHGHTVLKFDPKTYTYEAFNEYLFKAILADQGQAYDHLLKYDKTCSVMLDFWAFGKLFDWLRPLAARSAARAKQNVTHGALAAKPIRSVSEWFKRTIEHQDFQQEFIKYWKQQRLDAVICPTWPGSATKIELAPHVTACGTYTVIWNVMNFPAGVVPVTKVTASDVKKTLDPSTYPAFYQQEKDLQADARGSEGLPISVQVAGLPYTEETVLRVMAELEESARSESE